MKVLIACECSGQVRRAFRQRGHDAWSCDLQPSDDNSPYHVHGDVLELLDRTEDEWDLLIAHPTCRYLANSGVQHLFKEEGRKDKMIHAVAFFHRLLYTSIPRICVENPIPHKYGIGKTYSQIIQPWMFGHMETKATCLWLRNLPLLVETNNVKDAMKLLPDKDRQRLFYLSPGPEREKLRSETYRGIAQAMAEQWGDLEPWNF